MTFNVEIHPVKWLYYYLGEEKRKAASIIASSYELRENKITDLQSSLLLSFDDIKETKSRNSFNKTFAKKIHTYVDDIPRDIEVLFVCCDSGESRSSAIAAAILRYFGEDDMIIWRNPHYHPNPLVYRILCDEFGVVLSEGEVEEKTMINKVALSEAIATSRNNDFPNDK